MPTAMWITNIAVSIFVGGLAGWGASYVNYDINNRTNRMKRRAESVDLWRKELIAPWKPTSGNLAVGAQGHWITEKEAYASLAMHLSSELRSRIEAQKGKKMGVHVVRVNLDGEAQLRLDLINEIAEIERKWKLV